ncbi:1-acyl-sn-glycerol-3-phosphate acyltransferase alpha isoform X1 [Anastrepha ludens]|uniref:1-acyl-sn-glycerol-3-phosphate acyltransferase alpha isoform X1 n=2 Tax=Anastrepha ludens TaxID=28586 RepID=UPI0023AF2BD2|nr:1-acyl-sn-glycerol-3-phosphate acyltransferase alpha isoform X1 [Anastrepha ludens]XP_053951557.1 1-acyl-sn-glycerol-3-phosphate acyltransferase alpha isoform X1 [Anastrepha ludens]XP_053951559.1 1-acyl-sn-glycerol-3-phosphate acyltransferase alpha isoform X1 [Anastrepha ludens]XP_053951560.1 1-acyl-sn-glycerol-3-phosphate acyltransferase alpha isoform X1 [Anastrepha ludens]XP_053951561.1 1-acyl-sn-glycerol-3-phosphate acyltransferase alpha isoform X1 [Anastrepha ludens]XP_053951562.1 1-acy
MTSYIELLVLFLLLLLPFPFFYENSHIFRYYFKFFIYYGIVSFNSIILIPAFLLRPFDVRNLLWASTFCHRVSTLIGLRWELRGKEHLEKDQACIIVANHQSSLDILGMFEIWHVMNKCTVVAKRELFYAWPFGLAAWLAGLIFIDRVRGEKARDTLNAVNTRVKMERIKLWVYPEGTRRNTGELHPFKKGAFHMAIDEQIPIMPVVFSSYCSFLNDKMKILNAGNIIVTALPPINTTNLTKDDLPELMERVHRQMALTLKQTSAEVLARYKTIKQSPLNATSSSNTGESLSSNTNGSSSGSSSSGVTVGMQSKKHTIIHATPTVATTTAAAGSLQHRLPCDTIVAAAAATEEYKCSSKQKATALETTH